MPTEINPAGSRVDELVDCRVGQTIFRALAHLVALAKGNDPVECAGERGGIVCEPEKNPRWSGYECRRPAAEVELETPRNLRQRIVFLGQNVEDDHLLRLPLLSTRENRQSEAPGESYGKTTACIECLRCPVLHGDREHVVDLAGHRLARLDQDLLERRNQLVGQLPRRVGDAEREVPKGSRRCRLAAKVLCLWAGVSRQRTGTEQLFFFKLLETGAESHGRALAHGRRLLPVLERTNPSIAIRRQFGRV